MDLKKYFNSGSKEGDLSSETLASSDDPKKIHDGSLDDSNNPDDVFTEGLSYPDCVKILYNCIINVENQIHDNHSKTEETKMSQIKGEQHLMDLNKMLILFVKNLMSMNVTGSRKRKLPVSCKKMLMICLQ